MAVVLVVLSQQQAMKRGNLMRCGELLHLAFDHEVDAQRAQSEASGLPAPETSVFMRVSTFPAERAADPRHPS
jgi:hypothetical protein